MNKQLRCIISLIALLSFCHLAQSQILEGKSKLLTTILTELEKRHDVKFSFEDKTIKRIYIKPLETKLSLAQALEQLRRATKLDFRIINDRFIAITITAKKKNTTYIQRLEEVVVTNYLTKGLSKTTNGNIEINTKAFNILPGLIEPDILQIVQNLPGIVSADERISNINVRGGTNDQNLILYEGIRMYQTGHFFGLISAFNPYLSEKIDVSKNGTSAKFGDGVSSLITIKNSNVIDNKSKVGLGFNLLNVDGFAKIPTSKKTELQISARRSFTDLFVSPTYDSYFERIFRDSELNTNSSNNTIQSEDERFFFYDFSTKFLYDIDDKSKLRFNFVTLYNSLNYNRGFTENNNLQESKSALQQASYGTSINYSKLWGNGINTSLEIYFSNYNLEGDNNAITDNQRLKQENKVADYGLRLDISKSLNTSIKLNGGYQLNEVGVTNLEDAENPNFTSLTKEIIRTHAVFSEIEWSSRTKNTYARLGARASYFEKLSEILIEPRVTISQKIFNHFRVELLGELKSQSLTQIIDLQQDFFGIEKRRWQLANDKDVPLITSQQASFGLSYNQNDLLVSVELYYKKVDNITTKSQGFQNQFQFVNGIGSYAIKGIDFLINKRFNDFSAWLSYTYSKNDYLFPNLNNGTSFANTIDIEHLTNASFAYNLKRLKVGLGINWHSGIPFTMPSSIQNENNSSIEYGTPNSSRLEDYFRTDISAIYNFQLSENIKAEVGASIWNVFNQTNIINRFYRFDADDNIVQVDNRSLKFTPNFSFRVNF